MVTFQPELLCIDSWAAYSRTLEKRAVTQTKNKLQLAAMTWEILKMAVSKRSGQQKIP